MNKPYKNTHEGFAERLAPGSEPFYIGDRFGDRFQESEESTQTTSSLPDTLLLMGYLYVEEHGEEQVLVRNGRLPFIKFFEQEPFLQAIQDAISSAIQEFCDDVGIKRHDLLDAGFSAPLIYPLHQVLKQSSAVEPRSWVFFKLKLNQKINGSQNWEDYSWESKKSVAQRWHSPDFRYGGDPDEALHPLPDDLDQDPYKIILGDRVSFEFNCKVLECVDMLVFRRNLHTIQFLLIQRTDNGGWEYPKGGMEYHETPLEAGLRELSEEVRLEENALRFCGDLGWQTVDVKERKRFYDTLRVTGLTFFCPGKPPKIDLDTNHKAYKWLPFDQAQKELWVKPYGPEFFRRWEEKQKAILRAAHVRGQHIL
jgi:8-oxo-dGTP pyrophosphatase MutT (NUDIX family)